MTAGAIEAGKAVVRLSLQSTLRRDLAKQSATLRRFTMRAGKGISSIGAGFASVAKAGVAAGLGAGGAAGFLIKLGSEAEKTTLVFRNLIGSQSEAVKLIQRMNKFADATPFSNEDILQTSKLLLNTGSAVGTVQDEVRTLATLAARAGSTTSELALILQDIRGKGKIDTQDIRQFASRGINLRGALQQSTGLGPIAFQKRLQSPLGEGAISPEEVEAALRSIAAETPMLLKEVGESFAGLTSTMQGSLRSLGKQFGLILIEDFDLKNLLSGGIEYIKSNREEIINWFQELSVTIRAFALVAQRAFKNIFDFFVGLIKYFWKNAPIAQGARGLVEKRLGQFELIKDQIRAEDQLRRRRKKQAAEAKAFANDPLSGALSLDEIIARGKNQSVSEREADLRRVAAARDTLRRRDQSRRKVGKIAAQGISGGLSGFFSGVSGLASQISQGAGVVGTGARLAGLKAALEGTFRRATTGTFSGFAVRRGLTGFQSNPLLTESKEQTKLLQAIEKATQDLQAKLGVA